MAVNKSNKSISFQNNKLTVAGREIHEGESAPELRLTGNDMKDVTWDQFSGKAVVILSVPSLDTPVCSIETKRFNQEIASLSGKAAVLAVSMDLPFAQKRWCAAEGVSNVVTASDYKYRSFGENYGVYIQEMGLLARAVFVVGSDRKVRHVEYVSAISDEPDYGAALSALRGALGA